MDPWPHLCFFDPSSSTPAQAFAQGSWSNQGRGAAGSPTTEASEDPRMFVSSPHSRFLGPGWGRGLSEAVVHPVGAWRGWFLEEATPCPSFHGVEDSPC